MFYLSQGERSFGSSSYNLNLCAALYFPVSDFEKSNALFNDNPMVFSAICCQCNKMTKSYPIDIVGQSTNAALTGSGTTAIYGVVLISEKLAAKVSLARKLTNGMKKFFNVKK